MANESQDLPVSNSQMIDGEAGSAKGSSGAVKPSIRQGLHALTGDRDAEANALVDRTEDEVVEADARIAVGRAHGDIAGRDAGPDTTSDIATPQDAAIVASQQGGG